MMLPGAKIKKGMTILIDNVIYAVIDHHFNKPGKGGAFIRFKLKNVRTGAVVEKNFRSEEKFEKIVFEDKDVEFLYRDGDLFHFMDQNTFDQLAIPLENMGGNEKYLVENMSVQVAYYNNELLGLEIPPSVDLKVAETDPGLKGDTVSGATKPATLESGLVIQVPLFVNKGDVVKVDTSEDTYLGRA